MKETVPNAMPKFFENWCRRFDNVFNRTTQRQYFRIYLAGLLGESYRKNMSAIAANTVSSSYNSLRNFLHYAPWNAQALNERRLSVMNQCRQTKLQQGFTLIIDDSGHRKSGAATAGVGRQYIGEIGKTDNGVVMVTSHLYDGVRSLPLDLALYRHASSLPSGKEDPEFVKKPDLALELINRCLKRGMSPSVILMDAAYGNNTPFLAELETKKLIYVAAVAKNRNVYTQLSNDSKRVKQKLEDVARTLALENFEPVQLPLDKPRSVWVAVLPIHVPKLTGIRTLAIQMNAPTFEQATEVDYFITNAPHEIATNNWIVKTYSTRNWVEVFYREAKGWLGLTEYQVRSAASIEKHWILVFTAYTFIIWHQLTGGLRRRWANKSIDTFASAVEAFRTAVEYRLFSWLSTHIDVFAAHKAKYGFIWA